MEDVGEEPVRWAGREALDGYLGGFLNLLQTAFDVDVMLRIRMHSRTREESDAPLSATMFTGNDPVYSLGGSATVDAPPVYNLVTLFRPSASKEESLFIPEWGVVYALPRHQRTHLDVADLEAPMQTFLAALRRLFGLAAVPRDGRVNSDTGITGLELDVLLDGVKRQFLLQTADLMAQLTSTLKHPNGLTVSETLAATKLRPAVTAFHAALAAEADPLLALRLTRDSYSLAHAGFHDVSLLGDPYFPDEHKFAVYIPVYLPLLLPLLVATVHVLKERRLARKKCE